MLLVQCSDGWLGAPCVHWGVDTVSTATVPLSSLTVDTSQALAQLLNIWSNISRSIYTEDLIGNTPSKHVNLKTGMLLNVDSIKNHHRWRNITVGLLTIGVHMEIFGWSIWLDQSNGEDSVFFTFFLSLYLSKSHCHWSALVWNQESVLVRV